MCKEMDHKVNSGPTVNGKKQKNFIPDRLRRVRLALGYSVIEFADRIGVSRQALSQFEIGRTNPGYDTLQRIEELTRYPVAYFFMPMENTVEGPFLFRAQSSASKRMKEIPRFVISEMQDIYNYLDGFMDFAKVNVPNELEFSVYSDIEEIEDITLRIRRHWGLGLGPISNITRLLEQNGFLVSKLSNHIEKIDACSQWRNGRPYLFAGSNEISASRLRFNVAHEAGHSFLHNERDLEIENEKSKEFHNLLEKQAHRFASSLLMPRETFLDEMYSTSFSHLIEMKRRWGVSIAAIIYRCHDLGILTDGRYEMLIRQVRKYGKNEPLDLEIEQESPNSFRQAFELLVEHGVKTRDDILRELPFPSDRLETLAGLEPGFFTEKTDTTNVVFLRPQK